MKSFWILLNEFCEEVGIKLDDSRRTTLAEIGVRLDAMEHNVNTYCDVVDTIINKDKE